MLVSTPFFVTIVLVSEWVDIKDGFYMEDAPGQKEEIIRADGIVTKVMPATLYRVKLETGNEILAHISGKMRKHFIKISTGDKVTIEISPYDLSKGRVVFRQK